MKHEVLQLLLIDVRDRGSSRVEKKKLAWMLGRMNLNASAWQLLIDEWYQIAPQNLYLRGFEWGGDYTLTVTDSSRVDTWV